MVPRFGVNAIAGLIEPTIPGNSPIHGVDQNGSRAGRGMCGYYPNQNRSPTEREEAGMRQVSTDSLERARGGPVGRNARVKAVRFVHDNDIIPRMEKSTPTTVEVAMLERAQTRCMMTISLD